MPQYSASGDILAEKRTRAKSEETLAAQGTDSEKQRPREVNGGRDRLPQNHTEKNKMRLNASLAVTPEQAHPTVKKSESTKKRRRRRSLAEIFKRNSDYTVEKAKTPFPIAYVMCIVLITLVFLYVVHLYIEIDEMNASLTDYNNKIVDIKREETAIRTQEENKYDLEEIERIAREELGMVSQDQVSKEYITPDNEDKIEIIDNGDQAETPEALMSGFAKTVSDLLSYIN